MTGDGQRMKADVVAAALERYEGPLTRYAARITGDTDRARDVVQETFLRLWKAAGPAGPDHLAEWLFTVCRNRALDVRRKEKRMNAMTDAQTAAVADGAPAPPAVAERREAARTALGLLATLPANQQEVVRLKFASGFTYRQIANITGLSASNVGFLIHKAVTSLREKLIGPAGAAG